MIFIARNANDLINDITKANDISTTMIIMIITIEMMVSNVKYTFSEIYRSTHLSFLINTNLLNNPFTIISVAHGKIVFPICFDTANQWTNKLIYIDRE